MPYANREKRLEYSKNYYQTHKAKMLARQLAKEATPEGKAYKHKIAKEYYARHRTKIRAKHNNPYYRWKLRIRRFGLTEEQFIEKWDSQNRVCAICENPDSLNYSTHPEFNISIDHNHDTGKFRGLLCINCNLGIGHFRDNPKLLGKAIQYLAKTENK